MAWMAAFTLLAGLSAASAAAEPTIELRHGAAFTIAAPAVERRANAISLHGAACRRAFAQGPPAYIQLQRISGDGDVMSTHHARIRGMPGYRGGCGFYAFTNIANAHRLRLSPAR